MDNWVVGKEEVCYWLSNDIVGLVGNLARVMATIELSSRYESKSA